MRNDTIAVKTERVSNARESIKENKVPVPNGSKNKRKSPDEGIQSATQSENDLAGAGKRSNSVECLIPKAVEIDVTSEDDNDKMPPPAIPKKTAKKTRTKQKKQVEEAPVEEPPKGVLRVTRSKIKQEKISIEMNPTIETTEIDTTSAGGSKKGKKKYPMPILVKIEASEEYSEKCSVDSLPVFAGDATFDVPAPVMNETVTISANPNTTVTLEKNLHDSLMTEDNDEDEDIPLVKPKQQKKTMPPLPALKLKKNEVFK